MSEHKPDITKIAKPSSEERQRLSRLNKSLAKTERSLRMIQACAFGGRAEFCPHYKELLDRCERIENMAGAALAAIQPHLPKTTPVT